MKWLQRLTKFFMISIQRKLMLVMSMVVALAMIIFGAYLINTQRQTATTELEDRATRTVDLLAQTIALPLWNVDTVSIRAQLEAIRADPEVNAVRVIETGKNEPTVESKQETPAKDPISRRAEVVFQRGEEKISLGTVEIIYSSELLNQSLTQITVLIGFIILVLVSIQMVFIYLFVGRLVTSPLREMTTLTSRVAAGDYQSRIKLASQDEMNSLADAFNSMTSQLSQTLEGLEQRVTERTLDLETSKTLTEKHAKDLEVVADISRSMAAIQDLDQLLPVIAKSISEHLKYYHTGIYLLNETGNFLTIKAASSEGGQRMLMRQDTLPVEPSSLVGFVASRKQARIAQHVEQDATYLADSDLPETKSEAGLPLLVGRELIGVLDVQSTQANAFSGQDVNVLMTLANQIAISVQNARLFGETRRALVEAEKTYQQFIQQGWSRIIKSAPVQGYKYSQIGLSPLDETLAIEPVPEGAGLETPETRSAILSIPIKLRDQTIGTVSIHPTDFSARELDEDELTIIQATVERAALALENARLLEDSQRRATRERAISEISSKISEQSEIEAVLRSAAEELGKKLSNAEVIVEISAH